MNKLTINIFILIFLSTFIHSCQGAKDALQGKKRSEQSDEFLVKKKNSLAIPPDFDKLPKPEDQETLKEQKTSSSEVKELLKIKEINCDDIENLKKEECKNTKKLKVENNSDQSEDIIGNILKKIK